MQVCFSIWFSNRKEKKHFIKLCLLSVAEPDQGLTVDQATPPLNYQSHGKNTICLGYEFTSQRTEDWTTVRVISMEKMGRLTLE